MIPQFAQAIWEILESPCSFAVLGAAGAAAGAGARQERRRWQDRAGMSWDELG